MTEPYILNDDQEVWLKELESGKYPQGETYLCSPKGYCCIGVAAEIFKTADTDVIQYESVDGLKITSYDDQDQSAPEYVMKLLRLRGSLGERVMDEDDEDFDEEFPHELTEYDSLATLNDEGHSFAQIAAIIRANPGKYFK